MKIYALLGLSLAALAGIWYVMDLAADNERLTANNANLIESNASYTVTLNEMMARERAKDKAIKERTARILKLNKLILRAKDEVRTITAELVTEKERECLLAPVPDAIIHFMFSEGTGSTEAPNSEDVPSDGIIREVPGT